MLFFVDVFPRLIMFEQLNNCLNIHFRYEFACKYDTSAKFELVLVNILLTTHEKLNK